MKKFKKILIGISIGIVALILVAIPVLAQTYYADVTLTESGGSAYTMFPATVPLNVSNLVTNNYITATGLDTRLLEGATARHHMLADDRLLFADNLSASSSVTYQFTTGNALISAFNVITGYDGYVTIPDAPAIELGNDFEVEQDAYVDTSAGTGKNLVYKPDAFKTWISGATDISTSIALLNDTQILDPNAAGDETDWAIFGGLPTNWETVADNNDATYVHNTMSADATDLYNIEPMSIPSAVGTIASVTVHIRWQTGNPGVSGFVYIGVKTGGVEDWSGGQTADNAWEEDTVTWNVNPDTAVAWTNDDLTNLQIGIETRVGGAAQDARVAKVWAVIVFNNEEDSPVTATGIASGDKTVTTGTDDLIWATDDVLHFDGTATSNVNCGNIGNGAKFWISLWFKLDADWSAGSGNQFLFAKKQGANDQLMLYLRTTTGLLRYNHKAGGVMSFDISIASPEGTGTWNADTWYHVFASLGQATGGGAASDGARLRANNGTAETDADATALNNTGNFIIGNETDGAIFGIDGVISNVAWGNDDVSAAEEASLYANSFLGDEQDLWYIDEGTGTNIVSYGALATAGTADAACTWLTQTRPCKLAIYVDGTAYGGFARPVTVPPNANDYVIMQNNVLPYMEYMTIDKGGVEQLKYQPDSIISGTTLPDETGTNHGTITWGANPTGVSIGIGSLLAYDGIGAGEELVAPDVAGEITEPDDMFPEEAAMQGVGLTWLYPSASAIATMTNTPVTMFWWLGCAIFVLMAIAAAHKYLQNLFLTGIAGGIAVGMCIGMAFLPSWFILVAIAMVIGVITMERSPSL